MLMERNGYTAERIGIAESHLSKLLILVENLPTQHVSF
jgi:hypothetical protein